MNAQCVAVIYDVVDDSLTVICQASLCPQIQCQPKYGILAEISFHREASSLIGRLTFGRCTVALRYNGGNMLPVGLHHIDVMLDHVFFFFAHAMMALSKKIAFSVAGSMLRSLFLQVLPSSSIKHLHPSMSVRLLVCSLPSHKFGEGDGLVKKLV